MTPDAGRIRPLSLLVLTLHLLGAGECRRRRTGGPASRRQLRYQDCGMEADRPIRLVNFTAYPMPIRTPGKLRLAAAVNITDDLPSTLGADVIIFKYIMGMPFKIPCLYNIGTCHYKDVCGLLASLFPTARDCPRKLRRNQVPCRCPFPAGEYSISRVSFPIPRLSGLLSMLAKGEYEARLRIYDESTKRELGCVKASFFMQRRHKKRLQTRRNKNSKV